MNTLSFESMESFLASLSYQNVSNFLSSIALNILSYKFLVFMAAMVLVTYVLPVRFRWVWFLIGSVVFYATNGLEGLYYLLAVSFLTWGAGLFMGHCHRVEKAAQADDDKAKAFHARYRRSRTLVKVVLFVLAGMCFVKYADIVYTAANGAYVALTHSETPLATMQIVVPLGLSYFTFQSVGYVVDCARGKVEPVKNPMKHLLFLSYFPQVTQGPITTYKQLMPQLLEPKRFEPQLFVEGFQLAMWGYFKKMVLADRIAPVTTAIATGTDQPGWLILLGVAFYAIRLYADFSGGMDVIRGASRMLGVEMAENFRRPFFSTTVAEYWRRWHISLGGWFRTYLFYPLTTSRFGLWLSKSGQKVFGKKTGRALPGVLATFLIFLLIGVWHVANWNAVIYGTYFGVMLSAALLMEPLFKKLRGILHIRQKALWWKAVGLVRTLALVLLAQYFAFTAGPKEGWGLLVGTFRNWDFTDAVAKLTALLSEMEWIIACVAMLVVFLIDLLCELKVDVNARLARPWMFPVRWVLLILLIMSILIFGCYGQGYDSATFLYETF